MSLQAIQALKIQQPVQKPGVEPKPPVGDKKGPSIGDLLSGKQGIKDKIGHIEKIGEANKKPLDLKI